MTQQHLVALHDGRLVPADSDEWRHECEARAIAALPSLAERRAWLEDVEKKRGRATVEALRITMTALWENRK